MGLVVSLNHIYRYIPLRRRKLYGRRPSAADRFGLFGAQPASVSRRVAAKAAGSPLGLKSVGRKPPWSPGNVTGAVLSRSATARPPRAAIVCPDFSPTPMTTRVGALAIAPKSGRWWGQEMMFWPTSVSRREPSSWVGKPNWAGSGPGWLA